MILTCVVLPVDGFSTSRRAGSISSGLEFILISKSFLNGNVRNNISSTRILKCLG